MATKFQNKYILLFYLFFLALNPNAQSQEVGLNENPDLILYFDIALQKIKMDGSLTQQGERLNQVRQYLASRNLKYHITKVPWARAIRDVHTKENALIFQIIRTPKREDQFYWLLPLVTSENSMLKLFAKSESKFKNFSKADILKNKLTALCENGSAQCQLLGGFGFRPDQIIKIPRETKGNFEQMILRGRADFLIGFKYDVTENLKRLGEDPSALISVLEIKKTVSYLAASKSLKPELLARLTSPNYQGN